MFIRIVFTYVNGRRFKFGASFLLATMLLAGIHKTPIPSTVCNFVESYQAVKNTHAPMRLWEQLVYSAALTKQRAAECKTTHGTA